MVSLAIAFSTKGWKATNLRQENLALDLFQEEKDQAFNDMYPIMDKKK